MPIEVIDTPDATITIEERVTGDGSGIARTVTTVPKPGTIGANREDLEAKARSALGVNATYLALANPTNAQNLAQIRTLTRECNGLIRLLLGALDDTAGT